MAAAQDDFWPKDIGETNVVTPVSMMRSQAALLGEKTNQQLTANVQPIPGPSTSEFVWSFQLQASALGGYRYELFRVLHTLLLYPARFVWENNADRIAGNPEEFRDALKLILGSEQTKRIISALLAQVVR